jgi:hypothetical protein
MLSGSPAFFAAMLDRIDSGWQLGEFGSRSNVLGR